MELEGWWKQAAPRERDMLVGEKVFGWRRDEYVCGPNDYHAEGVKLDRWYNQARLVASRAYSPAGEVINSDYPAGIFGLVPDGIIYFTARMSAAWVVVAKLREMGLHLLLNDTMAQFRAVFFTVEDSAHWDRFSVSPNNERWAWQEATEDAICLAALKALGITQVEQ